MAKTRVIVYGTTPPKSVLIDPSATDGAQIGVNLLLPDGTLAKMSDFGATPGDGGSIDTTDALDEGAYHFYFTDLRAQDAVGGILVDTATIDFTYTAGTSITADLKDLADSGTGSALVKITRDAKGRLSGTEAATTTDLTEGSNLYFTDERAQDAVGAALVGTGNVPLTYDDAGNAISAALSTSVLASLALADSATQPGDLATVATSGAYADLSGLPTLGTAAATAATNYATAAQGIKADSALQSVVAGTGVSVDNTNPQNPVISATGAGSGDVVGPASAVDGALALFDGTTGKLLKDGGALNKASVGLGNVDNTSDVNKPVSTAQQTALDLKSDNSVFADYIAGLKMVWVSGTALTVTSGAAYIPSVGHTRGASSDIAKTGLSLTASTWYHVYFYINAGTPDIEIVTTAPAAAYSGTARTKTGDTSRRYVASILTNGSGSVRAFSHAQGQILYLEDGISGTPFSNFLFNGTATVSTPLSLSSIIPITASAANIRCNNTSTTLSVNIGVPGDNASGKVCNVPASSCSFFNFPVSSSQQISYFYPGATSSGCYLSVIAYFFER